MLTPEERETIVVFNDSDEPGSIYTCSPSVYRRLRKAGLKPVREEGDSKWFETDKHCLQILVGRKHCWIGGRRRRCGSKQDRMD